MKKAIKKPTFCYAVLYRANGTWQKFGTRDTKDQAEKLGSDLVKKYIADYYKIEKVKK
jgi:hypothetical protein